jgi:hypothetical protein
MVSFTTASAVTVAAFVALIEPTFGAAVAARAGASLVGSAVASSGNHKARDQIPNQQIQSGFSDCVSQLHQVPPTMVYNPDQSVVMGNLPPVCINEVYAWNNQSNIAQMEAMEGVTTVINSTAIHLDKLPSELHQMLEGVLGKPNAAPAAPAGNGN